MGSKFLVYKNYNFKQDEIEFEAGRTKRSRFRSTRAQPDSALAPPYLHAQGWIWSSKSNYLCPLIFSKDGLSGVRKWEAEEWIEVGFVRDCKPKGGKPSAQKLTKRSLSQNQISR